MVSGGWLWTGLEACPWFMASGHPVDWGLFRGGTQESQFVERRGPRCGLQQVEGMGLLGSRGVAQLAGYLPRGMSPLGSEWDFGVCRNPSGKGARLWVVPCPGNALGCGLRPIPEEGVDVGRKAWPVEAIGIII